MEIARTTELPGKGKSRGWRAAFIGGCLSHSEHGAHQPQGAGAILAGETFQPGLATAGTCDTQPLGRDSPGLLPNLRAARAVIAVS